MRAIEVLLIDESSADAMLFRQAFHDLPVRVYLHIARDGAQALLMLSDPPFQLDLIFLNLNIPKITGTALLEKGHVWATPIIVFSSTASPAEKERCLTLGAREFVSKPKHFEEFSEMVRRIIERWAPQGRSVP